MERYDRDMRGYGALPKDAQWPGGAKVAVQFVINYEEGGENALPHGDAASEAFLSEIVGAAPWPGQRHWNMESMYEYGARAGFWRLHRLFTEMNVPATVYGVATALARAPEQVAAMIAADWEIASHGLKWIDYKDFRPDEERAHLKQAKDLHRAVTGQAPKGWYTGRCSAHTVQLAAQDGGFDYISDSYADDLPYWMVFDGRPQLIIPYTLDANDMRFATPQGFNAGSQFYEYLKDSFDTLYAEGQAGAAKMMNIGLHCRLIGRPGRIAALRRFVEYVQGFDDVWIARRIDIAKHWHVTHPYMKPKFTPTTMNKDDFLQTFGDVFPAAPWVAERAYAGELGPAHNTAFGLHAAFVHQFRLASDDERRAVLTAQPDLETKLAQAKRLPAEAACREAAAGIDALTDVDRAVFSSLNKDYVARFGYPFVIALDDHSKDAILAAFNDRLSHEHACEFRAACQQMERIAYHRLKKRFGE